MSYWVEGCRCTIDPEDGTVELNGCPVHKDVVMVAETPTSTCTARRLPSGGLVMSCSFHPQLTTEG